MKSFLSTELCSCHVSSSCEMTSTISNQRPEGYQTRLKYTKTKYVGFFMAWKHDFYKYSRSSHCYLSKMIHEHYSKILKLCPASVYRTQQLVNELIQLICPGTDFQNSFYQLRSETVGNSSHFHSIVSKWRSTWKGNCRTQYTEHYCHNLPVVVTFVFSFCPVHFLDLTNTVMGSCAAEITSWLKKKKCLADFTCELNTNIEANYAKCST